MSNKKILLVSVMENWGGGEEFILKLVSNITGYEFLIASPPGRASEKFILNNIKTTIVKSLGKIYKSRNRWGIGSIIKIIYNVKISTFRLLWILKKEKPSLIIANGLFAALYVFPSIVISRKKLIIVQHLIFEKKSIENKVLKFVSKFTKKIVCVSKAVRENVVRELGRDNEKIIVIPNGIEIPDEQTLRKIPGTNINFGFVGSIIRIKGIHLIIDAIESFLKSENIHLHIFGTTADDSGSVQYFSELKRKIDEHGISANVHFRGYIEKKEEIYNDMNIIINYSLIPEAFPFSVLEAMAYRKIIIAADSGGSKEIITNGENGFLVEPGNVNYLREKIIFCIKNIETESISTLCKNGYEHIKFNYSIEKFAQNYSGLLKSEV
jgi:glycosyltransferase involved in cell wall biosynthesis